MELLSPVKNHEMSKKTGFFIGVLAFHCTVDTGYMVIGYKVKSDIRSILGWYGFPYTKNYWIYGQISDIWSEILIKLKTKAIESGVF